MESLQKSLSPGDMFLSLTRSNEVILKSLTSLLTSNLFEPSEFELKRYNGVYISPVLTNPKIFGTARKCMQYW
ncbi:hypothetical protein Fluta_1268 [Fluviicola taffensis DSM 16823]|uniref:Uncharacterized protein n=1 Tax=Fluviicola taffensis (strain DSM 16823 / NCIMB 13979 / RW262) TaxID=755732 RepID=F2IC37_FLUTR|nr:hypothetical protein Fluta_1268 [Fluviicola taffensis DSM 16823]